MTGFVYFVKAERSIKIGYSTDVMERLRTLQTASAERLTLLVEIEGDRALERAIHKRLVEHRMAGEWFLDVQEVRDVMMAVRKEGVAAVADYYVPIVDLVTAPPQPKPTIYSRRQICLDRIRALLSASMGNEAAEVRDTDAFDDFFERFGSISSRLLRTMSNATSGAIIHAEAEIRKLEADFHALIGEEAPAV